MQRGRVGNNPRSRIIIQLWRHLGENPGGIQLTNPGNPGNPGQNLASPDPGLREKSYHIISYHIISYLASQAVVSNPEDAPHHRLCRGLALVLPCAPEETPALSNLQKAWMRSSFPAVVACVRAMWPKARRRSPRADARREPLNYITYSDILTEHFHGPPPPAAAAAAAAFLRPPSSACRGRH